LNSGLFALPLASLDGSLSRPSGPGCSAPAAKSAAFIAGEENVIVRVLVAAVTTQPLVYNPIVLHGPLGVGKSSVAHALAAMYREASGATKGVITSGLDVARAVAHAADTADIDELRSEYQGSDWLLIDDADRLVKRPAAQQFLVTVMDALLRRDALVIATLRQLPQATPGLLPRLASRMSGGLVAELSPPGHDARCAIARQTASAASIRLTEHDIEKIVGTRNHLTDRLLTAGKIRAAVYKRALAATPATDDECDKLDRSEPENCKTLCHAASAIVAKHYGVPVADLRRPTRRKTVAAARALAMYLVRTLSGASYSAIGKHFGGRDHSTVLYACRKLAAAIEEDAPLRHAVDDLAIQIATVAEP
jgi:chromosomal replication initiator protein